MNLRITADVERVHSHAGSGGGEPEGSDQVRVELARAAFFRGWNSGVNFGAELPVEVEQERARDEAG